MLKTKALTSLAMAVWTLCPTLAAGQGPAARWRTGPELERQLSATIGVRWAANPLRQALGNLSRNQGVAIFLDRRVDPDQEVEFAYQDVTLRELLKRLAEHLHVGTCRVGPVYYLGPTLTAASLAGATASREGDLQRLPVAARGRWSKSRSLQWPELSTPRDIVEQLTQEAEVTAVGLDRIPHDLWPEVDLPAMTLVQRLSLVLAGFHVTFAFSNDGSSIRFVSLPAATAVERTYTLSALQANAIQEITQQFPDVRVTRGSATVKVVGPLEAHEALERLQRNRAAKPNPPKPASRKETRYTLRIQNKPVGGVAQAITKQLERKIEFDPRTLGKLEELVSFEVRDATLEELLKSLLSPVGLRYQLEGETLRILPAAGMP
jgi:hypothetical protein